MRIVAWNCGMALHRKIDALMALRPDLAVISEAAEPGRLLDRAPALAEASLVWVGRNPHKGLLLAGFGATRLEFNRRRHNGRLHWMAPVVVAAGWCHFLGWLLLGIPGEASGLEAATKLLLPFSLVSGGIAAWVSDRIFREDGKDDQ